MKLIVAKSGVNAETATDPNDFIFHSDYNTFKIIGEGTVSESMESIEFEEQYISVAHGKSYTPFVFAFCKFESGRVGLPGCKANNAEFWFSRVVVTSTTIFFYLFNNTGSNYTPIFKYYICEAPVV